MTSKKFSFQLPGLALALALSACGGSDEPDPRPGDARGQDRAQDSQMKDGDDQPQARPKPIPEPIPEPTGTCTEARSLCATLEVPGTYTSKPMKLLGALYDALPPVSAPRKILTTVESPAIGVGAPYLLEVRDLDVEGEYFVYLAVYSEGGGPFVPVPGVDYVAQTERKVKFDGSPINLGKMTLHLEETP